MYIFHSSLSLLLRLFYLFSFMTVTRFFWGSQSQSSFPYSDTLLLFYSYLLQHHIRTYKNARFVHWKIIYTVTLSSLYNLRSRRRTHHWKGSSHVLSLTAVQVKGSTTSSGNASSASLSINRWSGVRPLSKRAHRGDFGLRAVVVHGVSESEAQRTILHISSKVRRLPPVPYKKHHLAHCTESKLSLCRAL